MTLIVGRDPAHRVVAYVERHHRSTGAGVTDWWSACGLGEEGTLGAGLLTPLRDATTTARRGELCKGCFPNDPQARGHYPPPIHLDMRGFRDADAPQRRDPVRAERDPHRVSDGPALPEAIADYVETHTGYAALTKRQAVIEAVRVLLGDPGATRHFLDTVGLGECWEHRAVRDDTAPPT